MSKIISKTKFPEWKGLDRISKITHEMGCIFREIAKDDVGIDGEIEIVVPKGNKEGYKTTGDILKVQAKSGESYIKGNDDNSFYTPVDKSDLEYWYQANFPTLFIVYNPMDDRLYYKEVKSYVGDTGGDVWARPFRIKFDKKEDVFTPDCREELMSYADSSPPRVSRCNKERLISNLLPVSKIPTVWTAPTTVTSRDEAKDEVGSWIPPCVVIGNQIYSFENLGLYYAKLKPVVDTHAAEKASLEYWWSEDKYIDGFVYMLNQLLGHHEHKCNLEYNSKHKRVYFPIPDRGSKEDNEKRKIHWDNILTDRENIERTVVKRYEYGHDRFWRHLAAKLRFIRLGSHWYLRIIPDYFFSTDGEEPFDPEKVGTYATRQKHRERNSTVLNHVLTWSWALSQNEQGTTDQSCITFWLYDNPILQLDKMPETGIANFGNLYDPSPYEEPIEEQSLFE